MIDKTKIMQDGEACERLIDNDDFKYFMDNIVKKLYEQEAMNFCGLEETKSDMDAHYRGVLRNMRRVMGLPGDKIELMKAEKRRTNSNSNS